MPMIARTQTTSQNPQDSRMIGQDSGWLEVESLAGDVHAEAAHVDSKILDS